MHYVPFGKLTYSNNPVCILTGVSKLIVVYLSVKIFVVFGIMQKNDVMNGYDAPASRLADVKRQLIAQSVIKLNPVNVQVTSDAKHPPKRAQALPQSRFWETET